MKVIHDVAGLSPFHGGIFVPTMGALHEGHFTLVREAAKRSVTDASGRKSPVIVSVFVNPTQFNDPKDLERYPRTLEQDAKGCDTAGADVVFAPAASVVYPPGESVPPPPLPAVATEPKLEDAHRPGHFAGVFQVVKRLFEMVQPASALFGEKDWQQLEVIAAMTREAEMAIAIVPIPTVREESGLAMSSRNVFLSPKDRERARGISRALCDASGQKTPDAAERVMRETLRAHTIDPEYAVVRDAKSLRPVTEHFSGPKRALIAARVGPVRLIDNCAWPL
jgi:pantoate--beta-alanine ligase